MDPYQMREWKPDHPLDLNRGMMTKRAMGKRVKLPNGDMQDIGRGSVRADGSLEVIPVIDTEVHMYLDSPGDYFDSKGRKLPDTVAAMAGYDIERLRKQREVLDKRAKVMDDLRAVVQENPRHVREVRGQYSLIEIGDGLFTVADEQGDYMSPNTEAVARALFDQLVPEEPMMLNLGKGDAFNADEA